MVTQTDEEVILTFMRHILLLYGIPQSIVTDLDMHFIAIFLRDYASDLNSTLFHITRKAMELGKKTRLCWNI